MFYTNRNRVTVTRSTLSDDVKGYLCMNLKGQIANVCKQSAREKKNMYKNTFKLRNNTAVTL